ncbi:hypothetical protein ACA910_018048 [Epithemia clementina (nom. ined.)]
MFRKRQGLEVFLWDTTDEALPLKHVTALEGVGVAQIAVTAKFPFEDNPDIVFPSLALSKDGKVRQWKGPPEETCCPAHYAAVTESGHLYKWGSACGSSLTLAVTRSGKLCSWGNNDETAISAMVPCLIEELDDFHIVQVSAGYSHIAAVTDCGKLFTWGLSDCGALGHGD